MSKKITVKEETFDRLQSMVSAGLYESIEQAIDAVIGNYDLDDIDPDLEASLIVASEVLDAGLGIPFTREMSEELLQQQIALARRSGAGSLQ